MDDNTPIAAKKSDLSRKQFFASSGMAVLGGGLIAQESLASEAPTGSVTTSSAGVCLYMSFAGNLDAQGYWVFPHGLGAALPTKILTVNAFIKLPDGKVRNISVEHIDDSSIFVAGGVPDAAVKVGIVYSKEPSSW